MPGFADIESLNLRNDHTNPGESDALIGRYARLRSDIDVALELAIGGTGRRHPQLNEAMRYAVVNGGKRFRAMVVMAVSDLLGGSQTAAIRVGAAIECVHAQSLVHDDLPCMDDANLRRGQPSLHRRFDEATAVLAGDALLALAFEILAEETTHADAGVRIQLILALSRALGQDGLAGGQMMDLYPIDGANIEAVFDCELRKTGALIRYAVEAGALISGCNEETLDTLMRFADNLGLMFQVRDDILDETGDAAVLGKEVAKDQARGCHSATFSLGLAGAEQHAARLEHACHEALSEFGCEAAPLRDLAVFASRRVH